MNRLEFIYAIVALILAAVAIGVFIVAVLQRSLELAFLGLAILLFAGQVWD